MSFVDHLNDEEKKFFKGGEMYEAIAIGQVEPRAFVVKDSGKRTELAGGMVRDTTDGKSNPALALDGPMFARWAEHLTKGAVKYTKRNWMKCAAGTVEERAVAHERFRESALRHFMQWWRGDIDEDHAAAVFFNVNGAEYLEGVK